MANPLLMKRDRGPNHEEWSFWCPACKTGHSFVIKWDPELAKKLKAGNFGTPTWSFDGNHQAPTFNPSLLYREYGDDKNPTRVCHLFIRKGNIEYLPDCTHLFKGTIVPMEAHPLG